MKIQPPETSSVSGSLPRRREPRAAPGQLRDAYLPNRRVRLGSDIASACAIALLVGLVATGFTWDDRAALFDLARSELQVVKLGLGYLAGPVLILITMPLVLGRSRQVAIKHRFRERVVLTSLLWLTGLAILLAKISGLSDAFTIQLGAYVTGTLLVIGLLATAAMWPTGLEVVRVDRGGLVRRLPGEEP